MPKPNAVKIVQDPADPQPVEVMERAIVEVAEGARKLLGSRLRERAVFVLLRDATNESLSTIERVLHAAASLDKNYLRAALLVAVVVGLNAGCATRGEVAAERRHGQDLAVRVTDLAYKQSDYCRDLLNQVDGLDRRVRDIEAGLLGEWDRPVCENYSAAAQKMFCHRLPRFQPYQAAPAKP